MKDWFRHAGLKWSLLFLSIALGTLIGLGTYTFWYAEGVSYFSSDPRACANCHIMREPFDSWQKASHHAHAKCVDCHLPHDFVGKYTAKAENGFWHSKGFTLQDFHEPIQMRPVSSKILNKNCVECHRELVNDMLAYRPAADGIADCVHCHASVGHGPQR